jgi:SAM-dependent methyltransferase
MAAQNTTVRGAVNAYDEIPYPGRPYSQTHPDRMAAVAALAGMVAAPVTRCRVLEVGCGDGANLVPMAYGLPGSEFVGIDLAERPVERGRKVARALGVTNLALETLDLADFPPERGQFDYVIAHGLYSWIPAAARDRLLALVASHLAPHGVAYVSYNTYPGCHVRRMVWEMLRSHTAHLPDRRARIDRARELARRLAMDDASSASLRIELQHVASRDPAHLLHDDLAEINEPVYFHEFVAHARRHGLQFLGEAELADSGDGGLPLSVRDALDGLDALAREQHLDAVLSRRFRQTLLCSGAVALDPESGPDRIATLLVTAPGRVATSARRSPEIDAPAAPDPLSRDAETLLAALLDAVEPAAPRRLTFDEITANAGAGPTGGRLRERGEAFFRHVIYGAARAGSVLLHAAGVRLTTEPGARPLASAIARRQLEADDVVTTLCHDSVKLDHPVARRLLPLLDGTRSRPMLVDALGPALEGDTATARVAVLDAHLRQLARLALLEG